MVPPGYELALDYRSPGGGNSGGDGGGNGGGENGAGGGNGKSGGAGAAAKGMAGLSKGRIRATAKGLLLRLHCAGPTLCAGSLAVSRAPHGPTLATGDYSLPAGQTLAVTIGLTRAGRKSLAAARHRRGAGIIHGRLVFTDQGRSAPFELIRPIHAG